MQAGNPGTEAKNGRFRKGDPGMKTKALFGRKNLDLDIRELEIPALQPFQVLVKVHACGVCGTDLNFIRDWEGDHQPLGHEIAGEVMETGPLVTSVKAGDRVVVEDCTMCGKCPDCKAGHPEFCRNMYTLNGQPGMSEYIVVNEASLIPFSGLEYALAALTEPLAVAYNAVLAADIQPGSSAAVFGPGPIGLLCARLCALRNAGYLAVIGRPPRTQAAAARLLLAEKLGARTVTAAPEMLPETVRKDCPGGVDRIIVTSPPKSLSDALKIIRYGGTIVYLGLSFKPGKNIIPFDVNHAIFNKITLKPSFAEPAINFPAALDLIRSGLVPAELFQTHTCDFGNCGTVLRSVLNGELPVIKPVFLPQE